MNSHCPAPIMLLPTISDARHCSPPCTTFRETSREGVSIESRIYQQAYSDGTRQFRKEETVRQPLTTPFIAKKDKLEAHNPERATSIYSYCYAAFLPTDLINFRKMGQPTTHNIYFNQRPLQESVFSYSGLREDILR